jgi:hypothetical protein
MNNPREGTTVTEEYVRNLGVVERRDSIQCLDSFGNTFCRHVGPYVLVVTDRDPKELEVVGEAGDCRREGGEVRVRGQGDKFALGEIECQARGSVRSTAEIFDDG